MEGETLWAQLWAVTLPQTLNHSPAITFKPVLLLLFFPCTALPSTLFFLPVLSHQRPLTYLVQDSVSNTALVGNWPTGESV